jgi:TetR/AcrR family transcriptional regulator, cholesterol catabolism regulator
VKNYLTMDTRERILVRAGELFPVMGIRNVTMDQIASDLGISKRTIYENFRDKDELVIEMVEYDMLKNNRKMLVIVAETDNAIEALFSIIEREFNRTSSFNPVFMEDIKKYLHRIHECFFEDQKKIREFSVSYAILERGLKEDIFRKELAIDIVDNFLHELVHFLHTSQRLRLMNLPKEDVLTNILLPYFRGICTRKGQELIDKYFKTVTN